MSDLEALKIFARIAVQGQKITTKDPADLVNKMQELLSYNPKFLQVQCLCSGNLLAFRASEVVAIECYLSDEMSIILRIIFNDKCSIQLEIEMRHLPEEAAQ